MKRVIHGPNFILKASLKKYSIPVVGLYENVGLPNIQLSQLCIG